MEEGREGGKEAGRKRGGRFDWGRGNVEENRGDWGGKDRREDSLILCFEMRG